MGITLNSEEIKSLIPHRYPFLLIDKIIDININESIIGIKNLSVNEEIFQGHFPKHPVLPGVLSIEICAQAAAVLCSYSHLANCGEKTHEKVDVLNAKNSLTNEAIFYLTTIDNTKIRTPMEPGDQLHIYVKVLQKSSVMWKFSGKILINNEKIGMETEFSAFIKSKAKQMA